MKFKWYTVILIIAALVVNIVLVSMNQALMGIVSAMVMLIIAALTTGKRKS
ncbi:hypothetical protein [Falsibacillus albus]|uniref:hypothetical protein n=1 Tax=Falsibacillus albus TaxID=2478915 RepID=UPI001314DDA5|nr:hypothetical protein [Falsibacillus albus]